jgi:hypothetical protein
MLRYPNSQISVVAANSDSRIKEILSVAKGLLTDIQKSPYRDRILIVLDSVHGPSVPTQISAMGIPRDNIIVWSRNGIEYLYPASIIDQIFGNGPELTVTDDVVERNGISYKKVELVERVVSALRVDTTAHSEFSDKLLKPLESIIGVAADVQISG